MAIWIDRSCSRSDTNISEPITCKNYEICNNPDKGFELVCSSDHLWKCKSCGHHIVSTTEPTLCPVPNMAPCPDPTHPDFVIVCNH